MRSKTSAALLLLGVFLLGAAAGAASLYMYQNHVSPAPRQRARVPARRDVVDEMARSLNLDPQQRERLKTIWRQSRDRYNSLSLQFRPQYEQIRTETNQAIRALLNPDQRRKFDETLDRMDPRHRSRPPDAPSK